MKTDPKTCDYVMEAGASRNYEPWREVRARVGLPARGPWGAAVACSRMCVCARCTCAPAGPAPLRCVALNHHYPHPRPPPHRTPYPSTHTHTLCSG
jgi:hypothetical protein